MGSKATMSYDGILNQRHSWPPFKHLQKAQLIIFFHVSGNTSGAADVENQVICSTPQSHEYKASLQQELVQLPDHSQN